MERSDSDSSTLPTTITNPRNATFLLLPFLSPQVLRLQSAYFSSLQTLLPSSLLTPPNTTSTAKYLRTGPPALLDFLRLQYLACITVPYLQAYDMYPKINELDKKKGSTDIREYAKGERACDAW